MYYVGIDIGSTASKVVILDETSLVDSFLVPTGWNGKHTSKEIYRMLEEKGYTSDMKCVATGYGRVCVDYADRVVTEITCHGRGGYALSGQDGILVDVGGQDTKIIQTQDGQVKDFLMNDKCAAGTGKFIEVMATRLGADLDEMYELAQAGMPVAISSMCTVFAESEVIGHIGNGTSREDIAAGVIDSVATRVANLLTRYGNKTNLFLTGGLCDTPYFLEVFSGKVGQQVKSHPFGRYAGALGAALTAAKRSTCNL
jgi:predicted CoA-substrate-specific enzyme activase